MHFSVMIFGDNVEQQMAPFQETSMGPIAPEYMEKVDHTDEVHELFQARHQYFRLNDGSYVVYRHAHHRDDSGKMVPIPGAIAVDMSAEEARGLGLGYSTLDDAAADLGARREGDRFFIEDNFNSKWDWFVVGGRWRSTLKLRPGRQGYTALPLEFDPEFRAIFNESPPATWQPTPGYCDQARKIDIDWVGMRAEAGAKAGAEWDLVNSWTRGERWSTWAEVRTKLTGGLVHDHYASQPAIRLIYEAQQMLPLEQRKFIDDAWLDTRDDYVAAAEERAGVPYAVVFNGDWLDSDMADQEIGADWNKQVHAILNMVPDEATITMLDCHV